MSVIQSFYFRGEVDGYEARYTDSRSRLLSSSEGRLCSAHAPAKRMNPEYVCGVCARSPAKSSKRDSLTPSVKGREQELYFLHYILV